MDTVRPLPLVGPMSAYAMSWLEPFLKRLYLTEHTYAEDAARAGNSVRNVRILDQARRIQIADPKVDRFVPMGKYYREGVFDRPNVFVCDIPKAKVHIPSGFVCTRDYTAIADVGLDHRLWSFGPFLKKKPFSVKRLRGTYSTINYSMAGNFWHWMLDCLPKVHSLAKAEPKAKITLLMPAFANEFQRETLRCVLPENFEVSYTLGLEWAQAENFVWASMVNGRCMGLIPEEYYRAIREPVFQKLGLSANEPKTERIYISRRHANHRRVMNEDATLELLGRYGFRRVDLERLSFREGVELFHRAEIVIGPHGAGLGTMFFSGDISLVVLYPTQVPPNYFHSLAIGLGQKHHFVCHYEKDEDANFDADLPALENVLRHELKLTPSA